MIFSTLNIEIIIILFLSIIVMVLSEMSDDDSAENKNKTNHDGSGTYVVAVDDDEKEEDGIVFNYFRMNEEELANKEETPLVDSIEYDDNVIVLPDDSKEDKPFFRAKIYYPRDYGKKREFLQCKSEEPIIFLCQKSCFNVVRTMCYDYRCPQRLLIKTNKDCYDHCKKQLKHNNNAKYIPPERYT